MKKFLLPSLIAIGIFANAQVDVTATVGTPTATYTTLKDAFDAVNLGTHQGVISFSLTAGTTETATAVLNASTTYTSLSIKPASGVVPTITGSVASAPLVRILGSNVTIDGSNTVGGTSRDLTITNTSVTLPQVLNMGSGDPANPLINVSLKNTAFINGINTSAAVVLNNGAATGTAGYLKNILIENNSVQKAYFGIYTLAAAAAGNGSVTIKGNDLSATGTNAITLGGVYVQGADGAVVQNNSIGNFLATAAYSKRAIWFATGTVNSTISGNTISNITYTGTTGSLVSNAITVSSGIAGVAANANVIISENNIFNIASSSSSVTSAIQIAGAAATPTSGVSILKNKITNIKNSNAGGYAAVGIYLNGFSLVANGGVSIINNFISDVANYGYNDVTYLDNGVGITFNGASTGYKIYNNTISLGTNQTTAAGMSAAINVTSSISAAGAIDLRNNIFVNSQTTSTRYAIYSAAPSTVFSNIDYNDYYSAGTALGYIGSARTTLTDLQTGFGSNVNSKNILPTFTSASDLHLTTANTTLNDLGTSLADVATDIDGDTRSLTTPDLGADEFSVATMAVSDVNKSAIAVYPNPFTDVLKISDVKDVKSISVNDISGREVKSLAPSAELNLSSLKQGLYIVNLKMEDGSVKSFKAIKK